MTKLPIPSSYAEKHKIEVEKNLCIILYEMDIDFAYIVNLIRKSNLSDPIHDMVVSAYLLQLKNIADII